MKNPQQMAEVIPVVPHKDQREIDDMVALPQEYEALTIKTHDDCQLASDVLSEAKTRHKQLEARRKAITKPLDDAKKSVMDLFRPATEALTKLEHIIKPKIAAFHDEQDRIRREAEAKSEEKARKEREKLEAKAEKLRDQGKHEQSEAIELQVATTVAVTPTLLAVKVKGASVRKQWIAEVTNILDLCAAIADGELPPSIIEFKQSELNRLAATWKNQRSFSGLKIYQKSVVASR